MAVDEEALNVERAHARRFECDDATEAEKTQQLSAKRWETSKTASRQVAGHGELLQELQSKVAPVTTKLREWRKLATEAAEKLNVAKAVVVLQSAI